MLQFEGNQIGNYLVCIRVFANQDELEAKYWEPQIRFVRNRRATLINKDDVIRWLNHLPSKSATHDSQPQFCTPLNRLK